MNIELNAQETEQLLLTLRRRRNDLGITFCRAGEKHPEHKQIMSELETCSSIITKIEQLLNHE